jgi:Cu/Ag efflux protein CusF
MRSSLRLLAIATATAAVSSAALAQPPQVVDAGAAADVVTLAARVEAVDLASRVVTVRGPLGRPVALKVDDRVRNLPRVKVGDDIVLKYVEAAAVAVAKRGDGRGSTVTTVPPVAAPTGVKPGGAVARQTKIVARIETISAQGVVLLEGPNSRYAEVKVRDPAVLEELKAGDDVQITYVEALVIDVVSPGK